MVGIKLKEGGRLKERWRLGMGEGFELGDGMGDGCGGDDLILCFDWKEVRVDIIGWLASLPWRFRASICLD